MIRATVIPVQMKINPLLVKVIHKANGGPKSNFQGAFGLVFPNYAVRVTGWVL